MPFFCCFIYNSIMKNSRLILLLLAVLILTGCNDVGFHSHRWTEPDYQNPSTCTVCHATRGLPLTADFDHYDIQTDLQQSQEYHTVTVEENLEVSGTVSVAGHDSFESDESHQALKGYKWHIVTLKLTVGDENSNLYGFDYNYLITDYYNIHGFENSYRFNSDTSFNTFTVNFNGTDYEECICYVQTSSGQWTKNGDIYQKEINVTWNLLIPEGYDGIVVGFRNSAIEIKDSDYLNDYYAAKDFVLFRVK